MAAGDDKHNKDKAEGVGNKRVWEKAEATGDASEQWRVWLELRRGEWIRLEWARCQGGSLSNLFFSRKHSRATLHYIKKR